MMYIKNTFWGGIDFCVRLNQWHLLPSVALSRIGGLTIVSLAFLPLSVQVMICDKSQRWLLRKGHDTISERGHETPEDPCGD